jgi:hypothetical protein
MAQGDECTLRIIGRYQSQNIVNTMHYRIADQTTDDKDILDQLCTLWETANKTDWLACHNTAYTLVGLKAFGKTGTAKTPGTKAVGDAGTRSGTPVPANVCRTITLYTADVKHRRRGRVMLSGSISEDFEAGDGSLTESILTLLATLGAKLILALEGGGDEFKPGIPAAGADVWRDFNDLRARERPSQVGTRRVREFYIG